MSRRRRPALRRLGPAPLVVLTPLAALASGVLDAASGQAGAWTVEEAEVAFEIRNAGLPVVGSFGGVHAIVCFDPLRPRDGRLEGRIDPSTIDTGIAIRDRHLLRREYFWVDRFGPVQMRSLRIGPAGSGEGFEGRFLLRIRDVEREVLVPFTFETWGSEARLAGQLTLNRLDYGLGGKSLILADDVRVRVVLGLERDTGVAPEWCR